jgi:hypothetical protein
MADLLIENLPDEVCCAYRSLPDEKRRLVAFELTEVIRQISCKRPETEDIEQYSERIREFREKGTLKPLTGELLEEALGGRYS